MFRQTAASLTLGFLLAAAVAVASGPTGERVLPTDAVQLRAPRSISVSADGVLYVADTGHHRVVAVDSIGGLIAETGGFGTGHGQFEWPNIVIADRGNLVWVLDYGNRRIEKFSRLLEYQGTLEILVTGDDTPHQPQALAVSPLGDLYVYDRDDNRLVRYDPLLNPQAELSAARGSAAVTNITAMCFVVARGLFWWTPERPQIFSADAWLNLGQAISLKEKSDDLCLATDDSALVFGTRAGIVRWSSSPAVDTLLNSEALRLVVPNKLTSVALSAQRDLYVLDGVAGTVFRFRRSED